MKNQLQIEASNPYVGAWVSASAGTGKTKILTDRAIRLLLEQVDPNKILCITFTNAAASEMQERIIDKLCKMASCTENELIEMLHNISGELPSKEQITRAKYLYENYLRSEKKINIHTLHSYCQKILQKFPLEADVIPSFSIIDEAGQQEAISIIRKKLLLSKEYASINKFFAENFHPNIVDELFADILQDRVKFNYDHEMEIDLLNKLLEQLNTDSKSNYQWLLEYPLLQNLIGVNLDVAEIKQFFLTKSGEPRKRIVSAKIAKTGSSMHIELLQIQERVYELDQRDRMLAVENYSKIISIFSHNFLKLYESYKKDNAYLDYDDLIIKTRNLLIDQEARNWVLYKLDGGIEHILVDEAQDTSPNQWMIIEALIQEFFTQEAEEDKGRTIFVVGDEKQSIFSFQGADVSSFLEMNKKFNNKISAAKHRFVNIELDVSYRSCSEVLDIVYHLFSNLPHNLLDASSKKHNFNIPNINAHRTNHPGKVELWPLKQSTEKDHTFWQFEDQTSSQSNSTISELARDIASYIEQEISSGRVLAATGKPISPGDFMILFRTRNQLTKEVINELQARSIPASGLDRIKLSDDLLIKDLLSVARFALNPDDMLNKASLLKAPFIAQNISTSSSFEQLASVIGQIYQSNSASGFFETFIELFNIRHIATKQYTHDCTDSLNEFLKFLAKYNTSKGSSLYGFVHWFDMQDAEIKRETNAINQVQIMTVHGSKGLQAPIVIMCDTASVPTQSPRFYWPENGNILTAMNSNFVPDSFQSLKEQDKSKEFQEYIRLLYVAMTRTEDHLIVCGYSNKKSVPTNCWYELIKQTMIAVGAAHSDGIYQYQDISKKLQLASESIPPELKEKNIKFTPKQCTIKDYITQGIKGINEGEPDNSISPLNPTNSIEYGLVFHKVLEDAVKLKNLQNMHLHPLINTLKSAQQKRILTSIELVQNNSQFVDLLKGEVKTELTIGAYKGGADIGRIDLLVFLGDVIHIIDYKTDKNPATTKQNIPQEYALQLESYEEAMSIIFPNHTCRKYILWLENAQLIELC